MTRRKGERPLVKRLEVYSPSHPVAHAIQTGSHWFDAWIARGATPIARLSRLTGIPGQRLLALAMGDDRISAAELDALARAWSVSANDLRLSIGDQAEVIP